MLSTQRHVIQQHLGVRRVTKIVAKTIQHNLKNVDSRWSRQLWPLLTISIITLSTELQMHWFVLC